MIESGIQYKIFPTGYETAHKFPTAFLLVSGCVKCQSSPATVSRPAGCEIDRSRRIVLGVLSLLLFRSGLRAWTQEWRPIKRLR